jgi:hypothetical protein
MITVNQLEKQAADVRGYATAQANLNELFRLMPMLKPVPLKETK